MPQPDRRYLFGGFEIRPDRGELLRDRRILKLAPQPFQVLALIVARAGSLVTRDELRAAVWSDGTTVEFDQGLNYCIRQIRIVLKDDARRPTYVETVPKWGYRLLVPVTEPQSPAPQPVESQSTSTEAASNRRGVGWRVLVIAGTAACVLALGWTMSARFRRQTDPQARRLVIEAEHLAGTWELGKVTAAAARYAEATRLEPALAEAWAGLTNATIVLSFLGREPAQSIADAETHARRALALDGSLAAAHAALGHSYWQQWKWREADDAFQKAVAGTGDASIAHQLYGLYLASAGRKEEAVRHARSAVELAPLSGLINYSLGQVYLQTGDYEAALAQARRTLEVDRHFPLAFTTLVRANIQSGRLNEATHALAEGRRFSSAAELPLWEAYLFARLGRSDEARAALGAMADTHRRPSLGKVATYIALGDVHEALTTLEAGLAAHIPSMVWLRAAPELEPLRRDPRFAALLTEMRYGF